MDDKVKKILLGVGAIASLGLAAWLMMPAKKNVDDSDDSDTDTDSDAEERFESALEELQDIQREDNSHYLEFSYFLKIFEISMMYAR